MNPTNDDPLRGPHSSAFPSADEQTEGLTKREYAALHLMAGLMAASVTRADQRPWRDLRDLAECATAATDALFVALYPPIPKAEEPTTGGASSKEPFACEDCGAPCEGTVCTKDPGHTGFLPF